MSTSEITQKERVRVNIYNSVADSCRDIADAIATLVHERTSSGQAVVLGLATGSTPVPLYQELIRRHQQEGLSFANVITFNLDEYCGLNASHPESYRRFMQEQLFDHIDIPPLQTHVPDGTLPRDKVFAACEAYEQAIADAGGIDIQILGIGRTGHIGFNEPGAGPDSRTRRVTLDTLTRRDAARDFLGEPNVPRQAITMGVGTILEARKIYLLAWGAGKAAIIARAVEDAPCESVPATFLQAHADCTFCIDYAASERLTRIRHPWLVGAVDWTPETTRHAILWLSQKTGKPLLKLVDEDYSENGMADLLTERGRAYDVNIELFNITQRTITGWPGGKPNADDSQRPERAAPFPKRSLVLSPEPLDDVFSMGGTLNRLMTQGHELTIAYLTSGNLAVPDEDVRGVIDLMVDLARERPSAGDPEFSESVAAQIEAKGQAGIDSSEIRRIKGLIRRSEARASARSLGIKTDQLKFLNLPFYETGRYRRFRVGEKDVKALLTLLDTIRPHQIFTTGWASDPLSVPALAFEILGQALLDVRSADWLKDCTFWLYRGPHQEWDPHEIDMAVPLSPEEFQNKLQGIYQHQSQRSQRVGTEDQKPENSWDLARRLNHQTAETYDQLGLPEYEALECFKKWSPCQLVDER